MQKGEEKKIVELRSSLALKLAFEESRGPLRFAAWMGRYLLSKWFRSSPKDFFAVYMEGRALREADWKRKHADPLFGLPDEDYEWLSFASWKFSKAPFRHARVSTVTVSTMGSPSPVHREVFLWLEKNIQAIRSLVPNLLTEEAKFEGKTECYGEADPEQAAIAFAPENIFWIELRGDEPVLWDIHAHHPTEQDVYVTIEGSDEIVTRAFLSM
jgi:hypothetical protein